MVSFWAAARLLQCALVTAAADCAHELVNLIEIEMSMMQRLRIVGPRAQGICKAKMFDLAGKPILGRQVL